MAHALEFNGTGYLTAGSPHNALATTSYRLLIVGAFPGTPAVAYIIQGNNGNDRVRIRIDNFNFFEIRYTTSSSRVRWSVDPSLWFDGTPHTFEVVRSGSTHELFIDDISQGTSSSSTTASDTANFIGRANTSTTDPYTLYQYQAYDADVGGSLIFDYAGKDGIGTELVNNVGTNAVQQGTWPADDSEWLYYDDGSGGGGEEQVVVLSNAVQAERASALNISQHQPSVAAQAIQRESASTLLIEALQQVAVFNAIQAERAQAQQIVTTQQVTGRAAIQNESAAPMSIEQAGAQNITLVKAVQAETASVLSAAQQQTLQSVIAVQLENAGVSNITESQVITLATARQNETAAALNIEQYSGQLVTLIAATQKETAPALFISTVSAAELRPATQKEVAQQHQVNQHQQIIQVNAVQREVADILHILTSGDMTDLTGLRLIPITETYSLKPINHVTYTLREL